MFTSCAVLSSILAFSASSRKRCMAALSSLTIHALVFFEFVLEVIDDYAVEVGAAQMRVAVGGLNLKHTVAEFQNGHVEGATAKVVDGNLLVLFLGFVQP